MRRRFILCKLGIPSNEIWYTTNDSSIIEPYGNISISSNIISNSYANGKGVIVFDRAITSIGNNAFRERASLTEIIIPNSVTSIGDRAFYGCSSLKSITIGNGVTSIGDGAFYRCTSLTSITIPDGVTSIGERAFSSCTSLTSVTIPDSVTSIGGYAFYECISLTSITIPDSVTSIGEWAFNWCTSLKTIFCKPTTPPTGGIYMFYNQASGCTIYVPTESVEAYKTAEHWSDYARAIVGYDF